MKIKWDHKFELKAYYRSLHIVGAQLLTPIVRNKFMGSSYKNETCQGWTDLHSYHVQFGLESDLGDIIMKHLLVCNY